MSFKIKYIINKIIGNNKVNCTCLDGIFKGLNLTYCTTSAMIITGKGSPKIAKILYGN